MTSFKHLGLSKEALKVISELGFEKPSEIQEKAIPILMEGYDDFIGLAQTGTGKTAAFGLPLLEKVNPEDGFTQALVLAPTRELGQQIAEQLAIFGKYQKKMKVLPVYGGASISVQIKRLKKTQHIIIATPGRLLDLIRRKAVHLEHLQYLILDEADEMLNMGFKEDLNKILSYTPKEKLTWLFSATMPADIRKIVKTYMDKPVEVSVSTTNEVNVNIVHQYVIVKQTNKLEALTRFLQVDPSMRGLVFCRTKRDTQELAEALMKMQYKADALHGDLNQHQRDKVMRRFKAHELQVLIATDVAARGIDVNDLTHVFHYTLPDDVPYYTHRSGRTARAGKKGISLSFINNREHRKVDKIARELGIFFKKVHIPDAMEIAELKVDNWCHDVLNTRTRNKIEPEIMEKVNILFGNLSKEELAAKLLMKELEQISLSSSKDLNEKEVREKKQDRPGRNRKKPHRGSSRGGNKNYRSSKTANHSGSGRNRKKARKG